MVIEFTEIGGLDFFHIDSCIADNAVEDKDSDEYASETLISDGCLVVKTAEPLKTIDPKVRNFYFWVFERWSF